MVRGELVQRESELAAISAAVRRAGDGRGTLLVIEGEAGAGKSSLLPSLSLRAKAECHLARGAELERDFPFGVALQLLERPRRCSPGTR